jgi:hypothetical protein
VSRWCPDDSQLAELTPARARDLIVTCFFEAQKETLSRAKRLLGTTPDDATLLSDVETIVRVTFRDLRLDWDRPTKEGLGAVVMALAKKSEAWGTPRDIVEHHTRIIGRIFERL